MISAKSKVYYMTRAALRTPGMRYIDDEGGARSSKTFTNIQILTEIAKVSKNLLISIASESMPHLKRGAIRDFQTIMADEWDEAAWNKSDCIYTFSNSGSVIEFFSVDQPGKVHGPARDILFLNEANHVPFETARQLFIRTRLFIIWDYNPAGEFWAHTNYAGRPDCVKVHSTYLDNCDPDTGQSFLTPEQIAEIESYKDDENWWRVYGLGELGRLEGLIFPDFELIDELPAGGWDTEVWGMDFGYPVSPTTLMQVRLNFRTRHYWVRQRIWDPRLLTRPLTDEMRAIGVPANALIYADCAEPKTIDEIAGYGFPNIRPCYKGKSVAEQLKSVLGWHLHVTKDSLDYIKELRTLTWAKDRAGNPTGQPSQGNDHGIDAVRYALYTYQLEHGGGWGLGFV